MSIKHKGFTVIQLVVAMAIFAILCGIGIAGYRQHSKRADVESACSDLRIWANNYEDAASNSGFLEWADGWSCNEVSEFKDYARELEDLYMNCSFDESTVKSGSATASEKSYKVFSIETKPEVDPWGLPYRMIYTVNADTGRIATVYFASAGPDGIWQDKSDTEGYLSGVTSDDIIMTLDIRESTR